jgi:hypothetical protein
VKSTQSLQKRYHSGDRRPAKTLKHVIPLSGNVDQDLTQGIALHGCSNFLPFMSAFGIARTKHEIEKLFERRRKRIGREGYVALPVLLFSDQQR